MLNQAGDATGERWKAFNGVLEYETNRQGIKDDGVYSMSKPPFEPHPYEAKLAWQKPVCAREEEVEALSLVHHFLHFNVRVRLGGGEPVRLVHQLKDKSMQEQSQQLAACPVCHSPPQIDKVKSSVARQL
jgi:hypothetical protein